MKKTICLALVVMAIFTSSFAQKNIIHSAWRDSVISIDGRSADWPQPLPYYDARAKVQYAICNDAGFLYICIRASDEATQMKIMHGGMDVWFDIRGGKKQVCAIHYPLKSNATMDMPGPDAEETGEPQKPDKQKIRSAAMTVQREMRIQGLLHIPDGSLPMDNLLEIRAALSWDSNDVLTYEMKIPFSAFLKESLTGPDTLKPISIGITINGLNMPAPPQGMDGEGAQGGGQVGGPPGGGMGGGPPGGGMGGGPPGGGMDGPPPGGDGGVPPGMSRMMELSRSQETWIKLRLAMR